jgi:hypothetical protein
LTEISWHALSDASLRFSFWDCLTRIQAGQVLFLSTVATSVRVGWTFEKACEVLNRAEVGPRGTLRVITTLEFLDIIFRRWVTSNLLVPDTALRLHRRNRRGLAATKWRFAGVKLQTLRLLVNANVHCEFCHSGP